MLLSECRESKLHIDFTSPSPGDFKDHKDNFPLDTILHSVYTGFVKLDSVKNGLDNMMLYERFKIKY